MPIFGFLSQITDYRQQMSCNRILVFPLLYNKPNRVGHLCPPQRFNRHREQTKLLIFSQAGGVPGAVRARHASFMFTSDAGGPERGFLMNTDGAHLLVP